jgi:hypothetical protein
VLIFKCCAEFRHAKNRNAECQFFSVMLSVIILSGVMLSVNFTSVMLSFNLLVLC